MNQFFYWLRATLDYWLMRFDPWSGDCEVDDDNFTAVDRRDDPQ